MSVLVGAEVTEAAGRPHRRMEQGLQRVRRTASELGAVGVAGFAGQVEPAADTVSDTAELGRELGCESHSNFGLESLIDSRLNAVGTDLARRIRLGFSWVDGSCVEVPALVLEPQILDSVYILLVAAVAVAVAAAAAVDAARAGGLFGCPSPTQR